MERAKGIEPSYEAWEASVLPLNYARVVLVGRRSAAYSAPAASGTSRRGGIVDSPRARSGGALKSKKRPEGRLLSALISLREIGAGEGIRTLDPNLGKVVLYH